MRNRCYFLSTFWKKRVGLTELLVFCHHVIMWLVDNRQKCRMWAGSLWTHTYEKQCFWPGFLTVVASAGQRWWWQTHSAVYADGRVRVQPLPSPLVSVDICRVSYRIIPAINFSLCSTSALNPSCPIVPPYCREEGVKKFTGKTDPVEVLRALRKEKDKFKKPKERLPPHAMLALEWGLLRPWASVSEYDILTCSRRCIEWAQQDIRL